MANPVTMLQLDAVASVMDMASCAEGSLLATKSKKSEGSRGNATGGSSSRPYDIANNPLHIFVGPDEGAADRGSLVTCGIIAVVAMIAVVVRSVVVAKRGGGSEASGSSPLSSSAPVVLPLASVPLVGFPSVLLTPAAFVMRMAVRSGVRLAVLSPLGGDVALGVVALLAVALYVGHVWYAVSPLSRPRGAVRCLPAAPDPSAALASWHRRLEAIAGPTCVWVPSSEATPSPASRRGGKRRSSDVHPTHPDGSTSSHSLDVPLLPLPPRDTPGAAVEGTPATHLPHPMGVRWLQRNMSYVSKARHYAWYGAFQLMATSALKGLASAQTEATCLGRNVASLAVLGTMLALLVLLRVRPLPSTAGWGLAIVSTALLLVCAVMNTANAVEEAQVLANAVVYVSYAALGVSGVGTALSLARLVVNAFPSTFGTVRAETVALEGGWRSDVDGSAGRGGFIANLAGLGFGDDAGGGIGGLDAGVPLPSADSSSHAAAEPAIAGLGFGGDFFDGGGAPSGGPPPPRPSCDGLPAGAVHGAPQSAPLDGPPPRAARGVGRNYDSDGGPDRDRELLGEEEAATVRELLDDFHLYRARHGLD